MRFPSFSLGGRERAILQGVELHLSTVKRCVTTYQAMVSACAAGDPTAQGLLGQVFALEAEADKIQRDLNRKIAEGAFFGGVREDILNLIEEDDSIADAAKDASRLLMMAVDADPAFLSLLGSEHMATFQKSLLSSVDALESLIQALQVDRKTVLARVHAVDDWEEVADTEKGHLLGQLFSRPRTMDPVTVIQLRDFILSSDDIADNADNASDVLLVLVAKGYG